VRRTKEIGIRKTLGASVANIVFLMSRELMFWVIVANIIAQPVAYYFVIRWLQNFPYRIELTWWMFALSGGAALLIALTSVSFQAIKAAMANPVESLRYE
jgi:putative ABC transport system permease protein